MHTVYITSEAKHAQRWQFLRKNGAPISSTWIDVATPENFPNPNSPQRRIDEIVFADQVILYCEPGETLTDSLVELGAALATGRRVICVGKPSNLPRAFLSHPLWSEVATLEDALGPLKPAPDEPADWLPLEARKEMQSFVEQTERLIKTGEANQPLQPEPPAKMAEGLEDHAVTLQQLGRFQEAVIEKQHADVLRHINDLDDEIEREISLSYACAVSRFSKVLLAIAQSNPLASGSLRWAVEDVIDSFYRLASTGHQQALSDLCYLATEAVQRVKILGEKMPEAVGELAAARPNWPGMIGPHGDIGKENEEIVVTLRVGTICPRTDAGWTDRASAGQPFRQVLGHYVARMIQALCAARNPQILFHYQWCPAPLDWVTQARHLPELENAAVETVKAWFDAGWRILCAFSGDCPETLPGLAHVGDFRVGVRARMGESLAQQNGQRREGLRERLQDAFITRYFPKK